MGLLLSLHVFRSCYKRLAQGALEAFDYVPRQKDSPPWDPPQAASTRETEKRRFGLPPGGCRGPPSSSHKASRMASMLTGTFKSFRSPQGRAGGDRRSIRSPRGEDRPLLGQRQERMRHHVFGMFEDGAGI